MTELTMTSRSTILNPVEIPIGIRRHRRRERVIDACFGFVVLTLLFSSATYAVSQLLTLAS